MTVFANGLEVACKAQNNKVIAAFPDVCFTPPECPATPPGVPVPYPSFGMDSDTDSGTSTVKIGGQTITQKNKSYYTKTTGTEAGCAAKKGVITSTNTGKEYAVAWSSNVKADGEPVNRMTDLSTNNHASPQGNAPPFPKIGKVQGAVISTEDCLVGEYAKIWVKCAEYGGEAHHIVPDKCFRTGSRRSKPDAAGMISRTLDGTDYDILARVENAPTLDEGMCICLMPAQHDQIHALEREALAGIGDGRTASVDEIYPACHETLENVEGLSDDCVDAANEATEDQWNNFEDGQTLRTSNRLPDADAVDSMLGI